MRTTRSINRGVSLLTVDKPACLEPRLSWPPNLPMCSALLAFRNASASSRNSGRLEGHTHELHEDRNRKLRGNVPNEIAVTLPYDRVAGVSGAATHRRLHLADVLCEKAAIMAWRYARNLIQIRITEIGVFPMPFGGAVAPGDICASNLARRAHPWLTSSIQQIAPPVSDTQCVLGPKRVCAGTM